MKQHFRYPGPSPFEKHQKSIFHGRDNDVSTLHRLVKLKQMVVLYSKSGLGKSSLLNAGLIPLVEEQGRSYPIRIRFGAFTPDADKPILSPAESVRRAIAPQQSAHTFLDDLIANEPSVWHDAKELQIDHHDGKGLLLIIDQFEELFTHPEADIEELKAQLAEALFVDIPDRYSKVLEAQFEKGEVQLSDEQLQILQTPIPLTVVMAIRSDRMHLLDQLSDTLPGILNNCYELRPLDREQAETAILAPAAYIPGPDEPAFATPTFTYTPEAVKAIIDYLTEDDNEEIASFQLQIVCQAMERKIKTEGQCIGLEDLGELEKLVEVYYHEQLKVIADPQERLRAERLIEEALVFEDEERRLSVYEGQIYRQYGISADSLRSLVDSHLLRAEPSSRGGYYYEISHDSLVMPVIKAKRERLKREEIENARLNRLRRESELVALRKKAKEEEEKRRESDRLRRFANKRRRISNIALLLTFLVLVVALWSFRNAQQARKEAVSALEQAEMERSAKDYLRYQRLLARANDLYEVGYVQSAQEFYLQAQDIVEDHPNDEQFAGQAAVIERLLNRE